MRVAIIGTSGQLATALRSRKWPSSLSAIDPTKLDISERAAVHSWLDGCAPGLVINASAYTAVDRAETDQEQAFAVNESGPRWLAEWCAAHAASLIHVSTDFVFDGNKASAYVESDHPNPINVYGASKLAGEGWIRSLLPQHVIVRTSWLFSAHGHNFVKTILRLAQERSELRVVADQHGCPTSADDLADALLHVSQRVATGAASFGTLHFSGAGATTWYGFAAAILEEQAAVTGRLPKLTAIATTEYPTPAQRPANSVLDTTAFARAYGVAPQSWRGGLKDVIARLGSPAF